jgi:hypothetical protein
VLCWKRFACPVPFAFAAKWSRSMTFRMGGWRFAGKAGRCLTRPSTSCSVSVMPHCREKRLGEILAWIKEQQDRQPRFNTIPKGPRRSSQMSGILKNRALRMAEAAESKPKASRRGRHRSDRMVSAARSRSQRGCRVTFQLCGVRDISTSLQHYF